MRAPAEEPDTAVGGAGRREPAAAAGAGWASTRPRGARRWPGWAARLGLTAGAQVQLGRRRVRSAPGSGCRPGSAPGVGVPAPGFGRQLRYWRPGSRCGRRASGSPRERTPAFAPRRRRRGCRRGFGRPPTRSPRDRRPGGGAAPRGLVRRAGRRRRRASVSGVRRVSAARHRRPAGIGVRPGLGVRPARRRPARRRPPRYRRCRAVSSGRDCRCAPRSIARGASAGIRARGRRSRDATGDGRREHDALVALTDSADVA